MSDGTQTQTQPAAPAAPPPAADPAKPVLGAEVVQPSGQPTPPAEPAKPVADAAAAAKAEADKKALDAKAGEDAKAAEAKKAADEKAAKDAAEKSWAEWKPKAAEGVKRDEAAMKEFVPLARELGLKPEQAQKLLDFSDKLQAQGTQAAQKASAELLANERKGWIDSLRQDAQLGGDKYDASVRTANKAVDKFLDADTKKFLIATGLDAHPGLVRAFHAVGLAMKDDSIGGSEPGTGNGEPTLDARLRAMYPNSPGMFPKQ